MFHPLVSSFTRDNLPQIALGPTRLLGAFLINRANLRPVYFPNPYMVTVKIGFTNQGCLEK